MAHPTRYTLVTRARPNIIATVRGTLAELAEPSVEGTVTAPQEDPLPHRRGDGWQRPVLSAPIPAYGGERLAAWEGWSTQFDANDRAVIVARVQAAPAGMAWAFAQGEDETLNQYRARIQAATGWISVARTI